MPIITLQTHIHAPIERCFDLSRSIDLHKVSTQQTDEEAIDGVTYGLIGMGEWVNWRARHLGVRQTLTTQITAYDRPHFFVDEMIQGAFQSFRHEHHFKTTVDGTVMTDHFDYKAPLGLIGRLADVLFLQRYMTRLLIKRNEVIKEVAEEGEWKKLLHQH